MNFDVTILGAGAYGTALAMAFARAGRRVLLWCRQPELASSINARHENFRYWPGVSLAPKISATSDFEEAAEAAPLQVYACASGEFTKVFAKLAPTLAKKNLFFVDTSKGIDPDTLELHSQLAARILGQKWVNRNYFSLSGPGFAAEIMKQVPTCVTLAGATSTNLKKVQSQLGSPYFRLLTTSDLIGTQLGGATKNVIAIAVGIADGSNYGLNAQAALITRGLAEMTRLGIALGAKAETFLGLSGVGDLVLTCTGELSRNRNFGVLLGKTKSAEKAKSAIASTIEGIGATRACMALAKKLEVEAPICAETYEMIFNSKPVELAIADLLVRPLRDEWRENHKSEPVKLEHPHSS